MKSKMRNIVIAVIILFVAAGGLTWWLLQNSQPGKLDSFAQCLKDKGVLFYGAFWCPHCQNQKKLFGSSEKHLPYVECSTPNSSGQLQVCRDADIESYPTWKFPDGSKQEGELSLQELSNKSGCLLPE